MTPSGAAIAEMNAQDLSAAVVQASRVTWQGSSPKGNNSGRAWCVVLMEYFFNEIPNDFNEEVREPWTSPSGRPCPTT